ncbi:hypothetical protein NL676_009090 [Syzygium grande]|nr:hypothetical protein NL676_009090 [Syzygium grande]
MGNADVLLSVCSNALVQLPLASDVDFDAIAHMTKGFSRADLQALLSDAQLQAVHDLLDNSEGGQHRKKPIITNSLPKSVPSKASHQPQMPVVALLKTEMANEDRDRGSRRGYGKSYEKRSKERQ